MNTLRQYSSLASNSLIYIVLFCCSAHELAKAQTALENGATVTGTITPTSTNVWTFSAKRGEYFQISLGVQNPVPNFYPVVRVTMPDGSGWGWAIVAADGASLPKPELIRSRCSLFPAITLYPVATPCPSH